MCANCIVKADYLQLRSLSHVTQTLDKDQFHLLLVGLSNQTKNQCVDDKKNVDEDEENMQRCQVKS